MFLHISKKKPHFFFFLIFFLLLRKGKWVTPHFFYFQLSREEMLQNKSREQDSGELLLFPTP